MISAVFIHFNVRKNHLYPQSIIRAQHGSYTTSQNPGPSSTLSTLPFSYSCFFPPPGRSQSNLRFLFSLVCCWNYFLFFLFASSLLPFFLLLLYDAKCRRMRVYYIVPYISFRLFLYLCLYIFSALSTLIRGITFREQRRLLKNANEKGKGHDQHVLFTTMEGNKQTKPVKIKMNKTKQRNTKNPISLQQQTDCISADGDINTKY